MIHFKLFMFLIVTHAALAGDGWWMTEPISLIQTNLRETDSDLDPKTLVQQVKDFPANTLLFSVGGITAHYPTNVEYHYRSDYLPSGKDLVGAVIKEAHAAGVRVIGRFDFSRARKAVYTAHPEWFYRRQNGDAIFDDNGLYSICINGGYYREKAIEILTEALERYEVDGVFFNWFGNLRYDYHGRYIGLCHCDICERKFREKYGRAVPEKADSEYENFIYQSAVEVAKMFRDLIHRKRPHALFMTYIEEYTDGIVSEADFYKWRPLPQWIYSASEQVNRALNTNPDKMVFDLVMPYQEMRYRFASTAGPGLRVLLYQNMAHGAFPAFVVLGTMDQPDKTALKAVRPVFQFYDKHKEEYIGQKSAARVILYVRRDPSWNSESSDYRGFFRLLSELHIPFNDKHRMFVFDLIAYLLHDRQWQLQTNAHPSVEITVMQQKKQNRTFVHLVNLIGHSGTAFFDAVPMADISIRLRGEFSKASSLDGQALLTEISGGYTRITIPVLQEYYAFCLYE